MVGENKPFPMDQIIYILKETCSALQILHENVMNIFKISLLLLLLLLLLFIYLL